MEANRLRPSVRLWGKKRRSRIAGWWMVGRVGEAVFFGSLVLVGVLTVTLVIGWQLISPQTNILPVGYGFWLTVLIGVSFIIIGTVGFGYQVLQVSITAEHRAAMASKTTALPAAAGRRPDYLPRLDAWIDSPGVRLRYRLPGETAERRSLLLWAAIVLAWDAFVIAIVTLLATQSFAGRFPWGGWIIAALFLYAAYRVTGQYVVAFFLATRVGSTVVEIDRLPLYPGDQTSVHLIQHGRMSIKKLTVSLVCNERATYHWGTDVRTETQAVRQFELYSAGRIRVEDGNPLRLQFDLRVPEAAMHSLVTSHNAIIWNIVVSGEISRWPSFCRSFPVVIYPASLRSRTPVLS